MGTMKAIQISEPGGDFELIQRDIPKPAEHEVLIKVEALIRKCLRQKYIFAPC